MSHTLPHVLLVVAAAVYVSAAACALSYLHTEKTRALDAAYGLTAGGAALLAAVFGLRWAAWGRLPMTSLTDSLNVMTIMASAVVLALVRRRDMRAFLSFYLPPLAPLCVLAAVVAARDFNAAPRDLPETLLAVHVGLAFLAYALFFGASVTSLVYMFQNHRLKSRRLTGVFQKLPSLEKLDHILYRLIGWGYPFFAVTLVLGVWWAWRVPELLGRTWWLSPKIMLSVAMAAFYAVAFHSRRLGRLRGPKLAYLVSVGFSVLLTAYLALGVLNLNTYNFWGGSK